jgi:hypothetical protein
VKLQHCLASGETRDLIVSAANQIERNTGFAELCKARLLCPDVGDVQLFVDDELLPVDQIDGQSSWTWVPGFYAGTVRCELIAAGESAGLTYLLDIAPGAEKVGQEEFRRLIRDVMDVDPALILGAEPATHAAGGSASIVNADLQYAYMFQYGSRFLKSLRTIEERPRRTLRSMRMAASLSRVRRIDVRTVMSMAQSGLAVVLGGPSDDDASSVDLKTIRVDVPFSMESLDCAANRCIVVVMRAVLRRAIAVGKELTRRAELQSSEDMRTSFRSRWPRRRQFLTKLIDDLRSSLAQEPFVSVTRDESSAAGLTAVASDPIYARAYRFARNILRPGAPADDASDWVWMSPSWGLYETWCCIRVGRVLRELLPGFNWMQDGIVRQVGHGGDVKVSLLSQVTFSYRKDVADRDKFNSISKELRPDLVLTVERGSVQRFMVLDAKYSQSRSSILEAMYSAHVYHDALRWHGRQPDRSLLLVPASEESLEWLHGAEFKSEHRVGITRCAPSEEWQHHIVEEIAGFLFENGVSVDAGSGKSALEQPNLR